MPEPRLLFVTIVTPRALRGPSLWEIILPWIQDRLKLDEPPRFLVQRSFFSVDLPEAPTSISFTYSRQMADAADYNDGYGDVEGEIIQKVKEIFGLETVYVTNEKMSVRRF